MKTDYFMLVKESIEYLERHVADTTRAETIASYASFAYPHFARVFSNLVGTTPLEYIIRRKLSLTAAELLQTDRKIAEIAMAHGFESPQAFTKAFSNQFNMPPHQYRKQGIAQGLTPPFSLDDRKPYTGGKIGTEYMQPMSVASYSVFETLSDTDQRQQWNRYIHDAWRRLIRWHMAYYYRKLNGEDKPLLPGKELLSFLINNGLNLPPHSRHFGVLDRYPLTDRCFGYRAMVTIPDLSPSELKRATRAGIRWESLPGGLYAVLSVRKGLGTGMNGKWIAMHNWLHKSEEYEYGTRLWLEEHITEPQKCGFYGYKLYMPIRKILQDTPKPSASNMQAYRRRIK